MSTGHCKGNRVFQDDVSWLDLVLILFLYCPLLHRSCRFRYVLLEEYCRCSCIRFFTPFCLCKDRIGFTIFFLMLCSELTSIFVLNYSIFYLLVIGIIYLDIWQILFLYIRLFGWKTFPICMLYFKFFLYLFPYIGFIVSTNLLTLMKGV